MKRTVLVVDDDPLILRVVATVLDLEEYDVVTAGSGPEAMEQLEAAAPDLVVTDLMMPDMDGFELCAAIRSDPAHAGLPIIVLTARDGVADRRRGADVGSDVFLTKPFSPLELMDQIDRLLDERRR